MHVKNSSANGQECWECDRNILERTITHLDNLQDRERERPPLIETVFHPVPSVQARLHGPHATGIKGTWNAARTTVAISPAGLGLLVLAGHLFLYWTSAGTVGWPSLSRALSAFVCSLGTCQRFL